MGKETRDTRSDKSGSGDNLEDSLDKASEQAASLSDKALAELFIEANHEAKTLNVSRFRELFLEEKKTYHQEENGPDPQFLQEIYDSLSRKEIHHKKLLEENAPTNMIMKFLFIIRQYMRISVYKAEEQILVPANWKIFSLFFKTWNRGIKDYFSTFYSLVDFNLRRENRVKYFLRREFFAIFVLLSISIPIIVLFSGTPFVLNVDQFRLSYRWYSFIFASSIIASIMAVLPVFFLVSMWFVNVNRFHNSKYFHIFLFCSLTVSFLFATTSLFNAALFYLLDHFVGITSPRNLFK